MVSLDELEAFDLMCWITNGDEAARLSYCNQSTISRRCQQVIRMFDLPSKPHQGFSNLGMGRMLQLERHVHQVYRFQSNDRGRLRLHAPYWTSRWLAARLPDPLAPAWMANPPRDSEAIDDPLRLLDRRILDAVITEGPQRPADNDQRYRCFDLYASPLYLCLEPHADWATKPPSIAMAGMGSLVVMRPRPYLSNLSKECCLNLFDLLFPDAGDQAAAERKGAAYPGAGCMDGQGMTSPELGSHNASFMHAGSLLLSGYAVERDHCHDVNLQAKESLVVLQEWGQHARIEQLLTWLGRHYLGTIANQQLIKSLL